MSVTPSYREYVIDQLAPIGEVVAKRMFGGVGLYFGEAFFGLIDDDTVFLRVDDTTRADFIARGMPALHPVKSQPEKVSENYYRLPVEVLEDSELMVTWARRAITAAGSPTAALRRKRARKRKSR